jgi:hypothetical protein
MQHATRNLTRNMHDQQLTNIRWQQAIIDLDESWQITMNEQNLGRTVFAEEFSGFPPSIPQPDSASAVTGDGPCANMRCAEIIAQLRTDLEEARAKECELNQAILDVDSSWAVLLDQAKSEAGSEVDSAQRLRKEIEDMRVELAAAHAREDSLRLMAVPGAVLAELDLVRTELAEQQDQVAILRDELAATAQREQQTNQAIIDLDQSWVQLADDMRDKAVAEKTKELQDELRALRAQRAEAVGSERLLCPPVLPSPGWRASTPHMTPSGIKTANLQTPWSTQGTRIRPCRNPAVRSTDTDDTIETIRSIHELIVRQLKSPAQKQA